MRSETYGWKEMLIIDVITSEQTITSIDLFRMHGKCSLNQAQQDSARYINTNSQKRQNNYQLYV
jgi:hypothetical protein